MKKPYIFWEANGGYAYESDEWIFSGSWWGSIAPGDLLTNRFSYYLDRWITCGPRGGRSRKYYKITVKFRITPQCTDMVEIAEIHIRNIDDTLPAVIKAVEDFENNSARVRDAWKVVKTKSVETFYKHHDDGTLEPFVTVFGSPSDLWIFGYNFNRGFMPQGNFISMKRDAGGWSNWHRHSMNWCTYWGSGARDLKNPVDFKLNSRFLPTFPVKEYQLYKPVKYSSEKRK